MPDRNWLSDSAVAAGLGILVSAVIWVLCLLAIWAVPSSIQSGHKAPDGQAQQQGTGKAQWFAAYDNEPPADELERYCQKPETRNDCIIQVRTARATEQQARLAWFGLVLVGVTVLFTALAAAAALATVWVMRKTAERQLRAYVFTTSVKIRDFGPNLSPKADIGFKNSGQTPAYGLELRAAVMFARITIEAEFPNLPPPQGPIIRSVLGPGAGKIAQQGEGQVITPEDHAEIAAGRSALYVVGRISYRDAFKRDRYTNFRLRYGVIEAASADRDASLCAEGNDAD